VRHCRVARSSFRVFEITGGPPRPQGGWRPLLVLACRPEFSGCGVLRLWVHNPATPLALASALRSSARIPAATLLSDRDIFLSSASAHLQSLDTGSLAAPPTSRGTVVRPAPLMDFTSLQHMPAARIHCPRVVPDPLTVRLQGLVTLLTAFAPHRLAGLVSSRQRSWDFTLRSFPRPTGRAALQRPARTCMPLTGGWHRVHEARDRLRRPRLPGFVPDERPWRSHGD
jgi:hypothetical protein